MFRIVFSITCANPKCRKTFATESNLDDKTIPVVMINFDMANGLISFTCPECNECNMIMMPTNEDLKTHRKLGGMRLVK